MSTHDAIRTAILQARGGQVDRALALLRQLVQRHPSDPDANHYLGLLLLNHGSIDQALFYFERAVTLDPRPAPLHANYALALATAGRHAEAVGVFSRALAIDPGHIQSHLGLTKSLIETLDLDAAIAAAARAVAAAPDHPRTHIALSIAQMQSGRGHNAASTLRSALSRIPGNHEVLTALVATLNYRHDADPREIFELSRQLGGTLAAAAGPQPPLPSGSPDRRMRIGYLSTDLRDHAVASFMQGPLSCHDRKAFDVSCYGPSPTHDATSKRLRTLVQHWTDISRLSDRALVDRIRADQIDILVELSGYTVGNRMAALAHRAAPVQITYLGYPNTTGVPAMDYRLVDSMTDPAGPADTLASEKHLRLDPCFLCFASSPAAPAPSPPPHQAAGHITFGSLNAMPKLSEAALDTWAAILAAVPTARLMLKARPLGSPVAQANILARFTAASIDPARITFLGHSDGAATHLGTYSRIDIALDPFPYGGTTTTCEAIHMGVPVVTLAGRAHAGRVGVSILSAVNLSDLVAETTEDYIRIAATLAADVGRIAEFRATLRQSLAASPLCDAAAFTRRLESAYRAVWQSRATPAPH